MQDNAFAAEEEAQTEALAWRVWGTRKVSVARKELSERTLCGCRRHIGKENTLAWQTDTLLQISTHISTHMPPHTNMHVCTCMHKINWKWANWVRQRGYFSRVTGTAQCACVQRSPVLWADKRMCVQWNEAVLSCKDDQHAGSHWQPGSSATLPPQQTNLMATIMIMTRRTTGVTTTITATTTCTAMRLRKTIGSALIKRLNRANGRTTQQMMVQTQCKQRQANGETLQWSGKMHGTSFGAFVRAPRTRIT